MQQTLRQPSKSLFLFNYSLPFTTTYSLVRVQASTNSKNRPKATSFHASLTIGSHKVGSFLRNSSNWRSTQVLFCSQDDDFSDFSTTQLPQKAENDEIQENEELELLDKPSPVAMDSEIGLKFDKESERPDKDEDLASFLRFFKPRYSEEEVKEEEIDSSVVEEEINVVDVDKGDKKVNVEYYYPKPGDFVVGVIVSGNENKLDVNIGADLLGVMLTKEVLPLSDQDADYLLCDMNKDAEEFMINGKIGIIKDEEAFSDGPGPGRPVVETGTVLFAEVLGRTLSGRPLISTRRLFRQVSWHRVRQIKELNEPFEVKITEWNTGGLLTRIEGLRAFLPKIELMNKVNNFKELKENVGRRLYVQIKRINEANNDLILSEKEAWEALHLREGTLLEGTVKKIFPYGAQIQIGKTNRSGLLYMSSITKSRITSVNDVLKVDEKVKVLVTKSLFPDKISLSTADLESEPGLFLSNRERVFAEAEEMAKKYRQKLPAIVQTKRADLAPSSMLSFDNEELYANWKWFRFERE